MIFTGDIAVPDKSCAEILDGQLTRHSEIFSGQDLVCNLEGLIMDDLSTETDTPVLFNHSAVLPVLKKWNFKAVTLANNHTLDRPQKFTDTISRLKTSGIAYTGAGLTPEQANKSAKFTSEGKEILLFTQCWSVMLQHQQNPSDGVSVATINGPELIGSVKKYRLQNPEAAIVVYFHWNFDLETLPFPSDRKLSMDLIDAGADIILGCHSHCIQGAEMYHGKYIIYGLGNFFMPWFTFINGHIQFPEFAKNELAIEWCPVTNKAAVHFFKYEPANGKHLLEHVESSPFEESTLLPKYSAFQGMSHESYSRYFRKNRRKKTGVPVYTDYRPNAMNRIKDWYLIKRIRLARKLAQLNLRGWNN